MVIWIAAILLIMAVALFVAAPLSEHVLSDTTPDSKPESDGRERQHTLAVQALRELEFDHEMGKIDDGDYATLKRRLELRAFAAMDGRQTTGPRVSSSSPVRAAMYSPEPLGENRTDSVNSCPQCGATTGPTNNFCPDCGTRPNIALN